MRRAPISAPGIEAPPPIEDQAPVGSGRGQVAEQPGDADAYADGEVRPDSAGRRLADEPEQRRHPQRAKDQADEAAEQADDRAGDDGQADVRPLARASRRRPAEEQVEPAVEQHAAITSRSAVSETFPER